MRELDVNFYAACGCSGTLNNQALSYQWECVEYEREKEDNYFPAIFILENGMHQWQAHKVSLKL